VEIPSCATQVIASRKLYRMVGDLVLTLVELSLGWCQPNLVRVTAARNHKYLFHMQCR